MDRAPRLSAGNDGTALAMWQTSDGTDTLGAAAHPLTLTYALWDGSQWLTPTAALTGLHDIVDVAVAAISATQAALVYVRDSDGVLSDAADMELYYSLFDGAAWSAPTRMTNDAVSDSSPALAYDAADSLHLVWLRGGDLVWLKDSWDETIARTVRAGTTQAGALGFSLSRAANGNLAMLWQAMGQEGADLAYTVYDATADAWSAARPLMSSANVEAAHSPAFGADGSLYVAYQKVSMDFVTRTFQISPTLAYTVTNLPQAGPSDLAIAAPQLAFYDGATNIASRTLPLTLTAGYTVSVQITSTLSLSPTAHTLRAAADPTGQVAETDEANNVRTLQTTLPDLHIDLFYTTPGRDALTIIARLRNAGVMTATAPFTVALQAAGPLVASAAVDQSMAPGEKVTLTWVLTDVAALAGLGDKLWVVADPGNAIAEADEGNNTELAALNILPDLAMSIEGRNALTITLYNNGYLTATDVLLTARQDALTGTLLYSHTIESIAPGGSQVLTFTPTAGSYAFVKADPDNLIAEMDESNNVGVSVVITVAPHRIYLPLVLRQS